MVDTHKALLTEVKVMVLRSCSCRNFGTGIITLMLSGTSVRSARRRRGAKQPAVAAAAIRVGEDEYTIPLGLQG